MNAVRTQVVVESPIGPLTLVAEGEALVGLAMDGQRRMPPAGEVAEATTEPLASAARQLEEYFAGRRRAFDLPLELQGTPFQRSVWQAMLEIPFGETATYAELAAGVGRPGAARAVGMASGRNPVAVVVPCHRVVGSDGSLTGFGGGLDRKRALLDLEKRASGLTLEV